MRDRRFVAVHRGGSLGIEDHRALMGGALACTFHVLPQVLESLDDTLAEALVVAQAWMEGKSSTGACITAARKVHAIARETEDAMTRLLARCIGQAVAAAPIGVHCRGAAWFGRKIVRLSKGDVDAERMWQRERLGMLPAHLEELIAKTPKFNILG